MTKLTRDDCALNAAECLTKAADGNTGRDSHDDLVVTADCWIRLLDAMARAEIGTAQRESVESDSEPWRGIRSGGAKFFPPAPVQAGGDRG